VQSQSTIEALQDSIERISEKITKVVPQYLVRYRDTMVYKDREIPIYKDTALTSRYTFSDSSRWHFLSGSLDSTVLRVDTLRIYNKTSVIIGEKGSWWQPKTLVVNVVGDNPYITSVGLQSYYYKPKERKWTLVAGPSLLFNGKQFYKGVAITAGYRVF